MRRQLKYPGGAYHIPKTIFEELEDEGITVSKEARNFPHCMFDFECYFDKEKGQELKNNEKLTWQLRMSPSVRVCAVMYPSIKNRNVLCLTVTPKSLLQSLFSTWVSISMKSSSLLREQYAVFEVLNHAAVSSRGETHEDQLAQTLVDIQKAKDEDSEDESRGIDLMTRDDKDDEEEIEPENENLVFLDDETEEQEDISFYKD